MLDASKARPVVTCRKVVLYPPGHPPIEIPGDRVHSAGPVTPEGFPVPFVLAADEEGAQVNYIGFPYAMHLHPPSGVLRIA